MIAGVCVPGFLALQRGPDERPQDGGEYGAAAILGVFDQVLAPVPWAIGTGMKTVEVSTDHRPVTSPHP